jgi:hypothetical protein
LPKEHVLRITFEQLEMPTIESVEIMLPGKRGYVYLYHKTLRYGATRKQVDGAKHIHHYLTHEEMFALLEEIILQGKYSSS